MIHACSPARPQFPFFALCLIISTCPGMPTLAYSESATPGETGLKIALEARARAEGFGNFTARQTMILRNRHGQESRRELRLKVLEVAGDGDKSLFVFDNPRDVQGTALLIHARRGKSGRAMALFARSETGQADQLVEPFRLLYGQRIRL